MIYVYRCSAHGKFELNQGIHDQHIADCPECDGPATRVFTPSIYYVPDCLWNKDGSKQSPDELPRVYSGQPKYYRGV